MKWRTRKPWWMGTKQRTRVVFVWWPRECEDGKTRWLCKVRVREEFGMDYGGSYINRYYFPLEG